MFAGLIEFRQHFYVVGLSGLTALSFFSTSDSPYSATTLSYLSPHKGFSIADGDLQVVSSGDGATSSADIVYNSTNGNLFYNPNGSAVGFGTGGRFTSLPNDRVLSAGDFLSQG